MNTKAFLKMTTQRGILMSKSEEDIRMIRARIRLCESLVEKYKEKLTTLYKLLEQKEEDKQLKIEGL